MEQQNQIITATFCHSALFQIVSDVQRRQIHLLTNGAVSWRRAMDAYAKQASSVNIIYTLQCGPIVGS